MPFPIIPILAGLSFAGSMFNAVADRKQSKSNTTRTIDANKEMAQYQYQQEMEQLKYMNEYNAPINQRKRLEEANLNPALMYKSAPQNVQTQMAKYQRPDLEYNTQALNMPNPLSVLSEFSDIKIKHAQTNNLLAQNENIYADTALKAATKGLQIAQGAKTRAEAEIAETMKEYSMDIIRSRADKAKQEYATEVYKTENLMQDMRNKRTSNALQKADLQLRKEGIYPGDPMYIRLLLQNTAVEKYIKQMLYNIENQAR